MDLIFFDDKYSIRQYGNKENHRIILLIKPGHYNIGILDKEIETD